MVGTVHRAPDLLTKDRDRDRDSGCEAEGVSLREWCAKGVKLREWFRRNIPMG